MKLIPFKHWILSFAIISNFVSIAQDPNLEWVHQIGGTGNDEGYSICSDANGNTYTTGGFQDVVDFDPGAGVSNLTSAGVNDFFIQKIDATGNFVWAKRIGGSDDDGATTIQIDASGNLYLTGSFQGTVDFDPGVGVTNLSALGASDIFILKLNSSGDLQWVRQIGGVNDVLIGDLTLDGNGNIYTTGSFDGTVDFDPEAGTSNLSSAALYDIFIQKLNSDGNLVWVKQITGDSSGNGQSISTDADGNVYSTGYFQGTFDFDPNAGTSNLTSLGLSDIYVHKLDESGNFIWIKQMGGSTNITFSYITIDNNGSLYLTGSFFGTIDFDPGVGTTNLTAGVGADMFVQKLDSSGSLIWAHSLGSNSEAYGSDIQTDIHGYVYITGYYSGTINFDPGDGVTSLSSNGTTDIFTLKLDALGELTWAISMGGPGFDFGLGLNVSTDGSIYTTGMFMATADFDPSGGTFNLTTTVGTTDGFLVKLNQLTGIEENTFFSDVSVYPNPSKGQVNIDLGELKDVSVQLYSLTGEILYQKDNINGGIQQFDLNIESGVYFINVISGNEKQQYKLVMN